MSQPLYFISDLHFHIDPTPDDRVKLRRLTTLFDEISQRKGTLFIVGDLFDFWFEYKYVIPGKYFPILRRIATLTDTGTPVHYFAGNHDYWIDTFFPEKLNVRFHPDPLEYAVGDTTFWICHGDGVLKADRGYRVLKKVLRSRWAIKLFRLLHPDLGFALARLVSSTSRQYNESTLEENRDLLDKVFFDYVREKFSQGYDYVVMGHIHYPHIREHNGQTFVTLGDWMDHFTYGYFDGETFELRSLK